MKSLSRRPDDFVHETEEGGEIERNYFLTRAELFSFFFFFLGFSLKMVVVVKRVVFSFAVKFSARLFAKAYQKLFP